MSHSIGRFVRPHRFSLLQFSIALCLSSVSLESQAQSVQTIDPIVVTAAQIPQPLSETLPSTTVLSREDIVASGAQDVAGLLRRQAGIEIGQSGGLGSATSIFMRGANSDQVLVIVDGVRINSVSAGSAVIQHVMLDQIDHIEIVRGNVSSLYGSEAIGGVIQIFTRSYGDGTHGSFDFTAGGDRTRSAAVSAGTQFGSGDSKTRAILTASTDEMRGFSAVNVGQAPAANPDKNGYHNQSLSMLVAQSIGEQEVGVRVLQSRGHLSYDDPTDYSLFDPTFVGPVQFNHEDSLLLTDSLYAKLKLTSNWNAELQYGDSHDRSANTSSYAFSDVIGTTDNRTHQVTFHNAVTILPGQILTGGFEYLDQTGTSDTPFFTGVDRRHVGTALLGYDGHFGRNEIQLNGRSDHYSDFGNANTGLAAYGFHVDDQWKIIGEASSAFKAPTFNDLYFPFFGNPDLKPERAHTLEAGLQYDNQTVTARASAYRTHVSDLIVYDNALGMANNIARAKLSGIEFAVTALWMEWRFGANMTFQRPVDEDTGLRLLRRSAHTANLTAERTVGALTFDLSAQAQGARADTDISTFGRIQDAGYAIANASVRYRLTRDTSVGVAVQNAFDRNYQLVDGYNTPGRVVLATVHSAF